VRFSVLLPKQKSQARFILPIVDSQPLTSGPFDVPFTGEQPRRPPSGGAP
jgi:hypothetical protein